MPTVADDSAAAAPRIRSQFVASVVGNVSLCREHYLLVLRVAEGFPTTHPGQFVQLACHEVDPLDHQKGAIDWTDAFPVRLPLSIDDPDLRHPQAMLRRPFSLAGRRDLPDGATELEVIHRVVGVGTDWLARRRPGDRVGVLGPLGNRFTLPSRDDDRGGAILVGGGVGIPPMLYLAEAIARAGLSDRSVAFSGAVSRELLPLTVDERSISCDEPSLAVAEFARHGIRSVLSTDDGSLGFRGFVTQALEAYLDRRSVSESGAQRKPTLYTCGPEPMMKRVAAIAAQRGLDVQVAVERAMACGMGTCQSCCIRVRTAGDDWAYKLACTDGPIFRGDELLW